MNGGRRRRTAGFSLMELTVALALGVPLSALMVQLFALGYRSSVLLREEAFLHGSAREVFYMLHREIRQAGYGLCRGAGGEFASVVRHRPELSAFFTGAAVQGFGPGAPPPPAWNRSALPDSDSIMLRRGATEEMHGVALRHSTPHLYLARGAGFHTGAVLLLSDAHCRQATLLQLQEADGLRLGYGAGAALPGNCSTALGGDGDCGARSGLRGRMYAPDSEALGWRAAAYYAGSDADGAPMLFRERLFAGEIGLGSRAEAVAAGVEELRILYGVDLDGPADAAADRYLEASQVERAGLWSRVQGVRMQLRLRSRAPLPPLPFSRSHEGGDGFLRRTLRFSVALRNGAPP